MKQKIEGGWLENIKDKCLSPQQIEDISTEIEKAKAEGYDNGYSDAVKIVLEPNEVYKKAKASERQRCVDILDSQFVYLSQESFTDKEGTEDFRTLNLIDLDQAKHNLEQMK